MSGTLNAELAGAIADVMTRQGVGSGWLATASGIPARTLRNILNHPHADVKVYQVAAIARALGLRCSELVALAEDRAARPRRAVMHEVCATWTGGC